ncbi:unnamed protein product [Aphanomyces euteiches]
MEDSWLQDLQFLIATDDQLQEELVHVCEILDEGATTAVQEDLTSSPASPVSSPVHHTVDNKNDILKETSKSVKGTSKERVKPQRSSVRQREEIRCLRQQVEQLTAVLKSQRTTDVTSYDMSLWERTAKQESAEKNKSLQENEYLKEAVCQHATFIEQMQRVFRKKPRLSVRFLPGIPKTHIDIHSEEWQAYKLAAQTSLREAAIHAIADRQYQRMQSAMVKADVFEREKALFKVMAKPQLDDSYVLEIIHHADLDAPFRLLGSAAWNVFEGDLPLDLPVNAVQGYTHIDPYTVYATYMQERDGMACHSNMVRKYYVEPNREVIVSRTVLEDAALPHMTKGAIENRCMWLIVKPLPNDPNRSRFTLLQHLVWPKEQMTLQKDIIAEVLANLKKLCFEFKVTQPGLLPMTNEMDLSRLSFPNMAAFLERGCRFLDLLKAKLNSAIEQFQDQRLM